MGIETKKTMRIEGNEVSVVELHEFLDGLPDGLPIKVTLSSSPMDRTTLTFSAQL